MSKFRQQFIPFGILLVVNWIMFPLWTNTAANGQNKFTQAAKLESVLAKQTQKSTKIAFERMKLGGIQVFQSEQEVRRILGKPQRVENINSEAIGKVKILKYPGLLVELAENDSPEKKDSFFVFSITATSSKYNTHDGVRIGNSRAQVIKTYGKPAQETTEGNINVLTYEGDVENFPYSGFLFKIKAGKVSEITCFVNIV